MKNKGNKIGYFQLLFNKLFCFILISVICINNGHGQPPKINKGQLIHLFKASIKQKDRKSVLLSSNPWIICNNDSAFFKSDTFRLVNSTKYIYHSIGCCQSINWTFYKKNAFVQHELNVCVEPTYGKGGDAKDWYRVEIIKVGMDLFIVLKNREGIREVLKVITINHILVSNESELIPEIVLCRMRDKIVDTKM